MDGDVCYIYMRCDLKIKGACGEKRCFWDGELTGRVELVNLVSWQHCKRQRGNERIPDLAGGSQESAAARDGWLERQ